MLLLINAHVLVGDLCCILQHYIQWQLADKVMAYDDHGKKQPTYSAGRATLHSQSDC